MRRERGWRTQLSDFSHVGILIGSYPRRIQFLVRHHLWFILNPWSEIILTLVHTVDVGVILVVGILASHDLTRSGVHQHVVIGEFLPSTVVESSLRFHLREISEISEIDLQIFARYGCDLIQRTPGTAILFRSSPRLETRHWMMLSFELIVMRDDA